MKKFLVCIFFLFVGVNIFAVEQLNFHGYISDNARIITADDNKAIQNIIKELDNKTTAEIAVVTVKSLNNQTVENVAIEVGKKYKIGNSVANNGIVILVAPNEQVARIEVATGITDVVSNSKADKIMQDDMIPYFKQNDYSKGIYRGVSEVATIIAKSKNITLTTTVQAPERVLDKNDLPFWAWPVIIVIFIFFALLDRFFGRRDDYHYGNRYYRNDDDHDNNKFGGGGGFTGGHGSTGKW